MEFNFNVNNLLADVITKVDCEIRPARRNADGYDSLGLQKLLIQVIDRMGEASAKAQGLRTIITTGRKLQYSDHILYVMKDPSGNNGRGTALGILKVGTKRLFVYNHHGNVHEMEPLCVLDFYVHESRQRMGCGRKLFDFMLQDQGCLPQHLAIDKPSFKFSQFLCKHYHLRAVVPQVNNFVIFEGFFSNRSERAVKKHLALGRPPSHPARKRELTNGNSKRDATVPSGHPQHLGCDSFDVAQKEHATEEAYRRQNSYISNGYGLPPVHPRSGSGNRLRSRPGSGDSLQNASNHTTPRGDRMEYQRNGQLRPISASGDDEPESRKIGINSITEQGRQVFSRHGSHSNPGSPQLMRPSPQLQRTASDKLLNVNQNAIMQDPASFERTDSRLIQATDSQFKQRTNSAELLHKNDPPLLKRNRTADDYLKNMNFHHEYQGRRGHMRVNTVLGDPPVRNPYMPKQEERVVHSALRPAQEKANWTVFNREPGYLSIASRNYTHTRLW